MKLCIPEQMVQFVEYHKREHYLLILSKTATDMQD